MIDSRLNGAMPPATTAASAAASDAMPRRPVIYIECTNTYHSPVQTGIQRVVRNVLRNAGAVAEPRGYDTAAVVFEGGQFRMADLGQVLHDKLQAADAAPPALAPPPGWRVRLRRLRARSPRSLVIGAIRPVYRALRRTLAFMLPSPAVHRFLYAHPIDFGLAWCLLQPWRLVRRLARQLVRRLGLGGAGSPTPETAADPVALDDGFGESLDARADHAGDILLLLDASWSIPLWRAVERFQAAGGQTQGVIYDLVPITHADTSVRSLRAEYTAWVAEHLRLSGKFLTISRTVGQQLDAYLEGLAPSAPWRVRSFYLGSELDFVDPDQPPRPSVRAVFADRPPGAEHVFIAVGSIEPRKNHRFLLDAFDLHWAAGGTARLVIIGRFGWKNEDVIARIEAHPRLGRDLFLMRDMSDSELDHAYHQASALVIASESEGFGLPVVEAFQRGLPVLCSDIAVFREIADGRAVFFALSDPAHLAAALQAFCASHDPALRTDRHPQPWLTWRESTEQLLDGVLAP